MFYSALCSSQQNLYSKVFIDTSQVICFNASRYNDTIVSFGAYYDQDSAISRGVLFYYDLNGTSLGVLDPFADSSGQHRWVRGDYLYNDSCVIGAGFSTCTVGSIERGTVFNVSYDGTINWIYKDQNVECSDTAFKSRIYGVTQVDDYLYCCGVYLDASTNWFVTKLNLSGEFIDRWDFPSAGSSYAFQIDPSVEQDGVIVSGYEKDANNNGKGLILKLDTLGQEQWRTYIDYANQSILNKTDIIEIKNNFDHYIGVGVSELNDASNVDYVVLFNVDHNGNIMDTVSFKPESIVFGAVIRNFELKDSSFVIEYSNLEIPSSNSIEASYFREYDYDFNLLWERKYAPRVTNNISLHFTLDQLNRIVSSGFVTADTNGNNDDAWLMYLSCIGFDKYPLSDFSFSSEGQSITLENLSLYADQFIWDFGDGKSLKQYIVPSDSIIHDSLVYHFYDEPGVYTINLKAIACYDTSEFTTTIEVFEENYFTENGDFYPNPFIDHVYLQFDDFDSTSVVDLYLIDGRGKLIDIGQTSGDNLVHGTDFNLQFLSAGLYVLVLDQGNIQRKLKIIKETPRN